MKDYAIENLALRREFKKNSVKNDTYIFQWENEFSKEEKVEFIDKYTPLLGYKYKNVASYILAINEKYKKELGSLKKNSLGEVNTNSLKAWIKRNDEQQLFSPYTIGRYHVFGTDYYIGNDTVYRAYFRVSRPTIVDSMFHDLLCGLLNKENNYYTDNDPVSIGIRQIRELENQYGCLGSDRISSIAGNGLSYTREDWLEWTGYPPVTVEEINEILAAYDTVKKFIGNISNEIKSNPAIKELPADKD